MLNDRQLRNLIRIAEGWVKEIEVEAISLSGGETAFTGDVLLPWLQKKVSTLLKPELYVRGDGGPPDSDPPIERGDVAVIRAACATTAAWPPPPRSPLPSCGLKREET